MLGIVGYQPKTRSGSVATVHHTACASLWRPRFAAVSAYAVCSIRLLLFPRSPLAFDADGAAVSALSRFFMAGMVSLVSPFRAAVSPMAITGADDFRSKPHLHPQCFHTQALQVVLNIAVKTVQNVLSDC